MEIWRSIPGYPNYEVSGCGSVRRAVSVRGARFHAGALKKASLSGGYLRVHLYHDGKRSAVGVHELICLAFHGPRPSPEHEAAHWDGTSSNNTPDNVRWATPLENAADRERHGRTASRKNGKHWRTKLTEQDVRVIRFLFLPRPRSNVRQLALRFGVTASTIRNIAGKRARDRSRCRRGHPQTGDNVYVMPSGYRVCYVCMKDRSRRQSQLKRSVVR